MFHILFLHRLSEFNQLPRASWTVCQCTREYYKGTVLICRVLRYWMSFPFHVWCRFHLFRLSSPGYVHADTWEDDLLLFRRVAWLSVCVWCLLACGGKSLRLLPNTSLFFSPTSLVLSSSLRWDRVRLPWHPKYEHNKSLCEDTDLMCTVFIAYREKKSVGL